VYKDLWDTLCKKYRFIIVTAAHIVTSADSQSVISSALVRQAFLKRRLLPNGQRRVPIRGLGQIYSTLMSQSDMSFLFSFQACEPAARMALNDVNSNPTLLPGYRLKLHWNDSGVSSQCLFLSLSLLSLSLSLSPLLFLSLPLSLFLPLSLSPSFFLPFSLSLSLSLSFSLCFGT
jgi:hypothetical protein